ncbi:hypothetical protein METP2_02304 [Methanosarcinales archaeon]|nr:hypothetical protein [Candidatus Methanoperedens sp.]CAG0986451.1 hypothetical protein METP2_02304 [Methanosarcinales archaeon]
MATAISGMDIYAPVFKVKRNGEEYPPKESILNIEIDEDLETPAMFRLSLNEEINIRTQQFRWLDDDKIKPGTEVEIFFGYATSKKQGMMKGRIKALTPGFQSTGNPTLSVEGYDLSHDLQKTAKKFTDTEVTYSTIAQDIAQANGLSAKVDPTEITHGKVERIKNEMDYDLLKRLSNEIGYEFFVRNKELYFREPKDNIKGDFTFEFRKNFINFNPRMTAAALVNEVHVTAWNVKDKESISESARINDIKSSVGNPDFDSIIEESQGARVDVKIEGRLVRSQKEAKNLAKAELKRRNKGFIEGTLECIGDPMLRPGITVNIEKVGKRFSGVYYITKATHSVGDAGYKTTITVRRSIL